MTATRISTYRLDVGTVEIFVSDCANCGVVFGISSELEQRRRDDGGSFYCPNGHTMTFGKGRIAEERERAAKAERRTELMRISRDAALDQAETAERRRRAAKGQLTKTKKRIANGVCPCCNRTFPNVADHMATKHPNYVEPTS